MLSNIAIWSSWTVLGRTTGVKAAIHLDISYPRLCGVAYTSWRGIGEKLSRTFYSLSSNDEIMGEEKDFVGSYL
jgi:hypothetical protein